MHHWKRFGESNNAAGQEEIASCAFREERPPRPSLQRRSIFGVILLAAPSLVSALHPDRLMRTSSSLILIGWRGVCPLEPQLNIFARFCCLFNIRQVQLAPPQLISISPASIEDTTRNSIKRKIRNCISAVDAKRHGRECFINCPNVIG